MSWISIHTSPPLPEFKGLYLVTFDTQNQRVYLVDTILKQYGEYWGLKDGCFVRDLNYWRPAIPEQWVEFEAKYASKHELGCFARANPSLALGNQSRRHGCTCGGEGWTWLGSG